VCPKQPENRQLRFDQGLQSAARHAGGRAPAVLSYFAGSGFLRWGPSGGNRMRLRTAPPAAVDPARLLKGGLAPELQRLRQFGYRIIVGVEHVAMDTPLWHEMAGVAVAVQLDVCPARVQQLRVRSHYPWPVPFLPGGVAALRGTLLRRNCVRIARSSAKAGGVERDGAACTPSVLECRQGNPLHTPVLCGGLGPP